VTEQEQRIERIKMAKKMTPPTKTTVAPKTAPPAATVSKTPETSRQTAAPAPNPAAASPVKQPASAKGAAKATTPQAVFSVTPEARWQMVSEAAYFLAEKRGFVGGNPCDDWIEAEVQVDALLKHRAARKK